MPLAVSTRLPAQPAPKNSKCKKKTSVVMGGPGLWPVVVNSHRAGVCFLTALLVTKIYLLGLLVTMYSPNGNIVSC